MGITKRLGAAVGCLVLTAAATASVAGPASATAPSCPTNWTATTDGSSACEHVFTAGDAIDIPTGVTSIDILSVGGGGGGAGGSISWPAAGGGGGGEVQVCTQSVTPTETLTATVGAGGLGAATQGANGGSGVASKVTLSVTIDGSSHDFCVSSGGSGGTSASLVAGQGGASGNGNAGGYGSHLTKSTDPGEYVAVTTTGVAAETGGGGGGAGAAGSDGGNTFSYFGSYFGYSYFGGDGGDGTTPAAVAPTSLFGPNTTYFGGGGGGGADGVSGQGGQGGGGNGPDCSEGCSPGNAGTANTGGGGSGGGDNQGGPGGGSGLVSVRFTLGAPIVTAAKTPAAGGTVSATDGDSNGTWDLSATPAAGYAFTGWTCDASQAPLSSSSATTTIVPSADTTCTATFAAYTVAAAKTPAAGGTVSATDGDSNGTWDLSATPAAGYAFTGWTCDASQAPLSSSSATTTIVPSADTTCTATFALAALITHTTETVKSVFVDNSATPLTTGQYSVQTAKGKTTINGVNPGVLYYWARFTSTGTGPQTLVTETTTASSAYLFQYVSAGSNVYKAGQTTVAKGYRLSWSSGTGTLTVSGLTAGDYWIGIKFSQSSLAGLLAPSPSTVTYGFAAGSNAATAQVLTLNKKG